MVRLNSAGTLRRPFSSTRAGWFPRNMFSSRSRRGFRHLVGRQRGGHHQLGGESGNSVLFGFINLVFWVFSAHLTGTPVTAASTHHLTLISTFNHFSPHPTPKWLAVNRFFLGHLTAVMVAAVD